MFRWIIYIYIYIYMRENKGAGHLINLDVHWCMATKFWWSSCVKFYHQRLAWSKRYNKHFVFYTKINNESPITAFNNLIFAQHVEYGSFRHFTKEHDWVAVASLVARYRFVLVCNVTNITQKKKRVIKQLCLTS